MVHTFCRYQWKVNFYITQGCFQSECFTGIEHSSTVANYSLFVSHSHLRQYEPGFFWRLQIVHLLVFNPQILHPTYAIFTSLVGLTLFSNTIVIGFSLIRVTNYKVSILKRKSFEETPQIGKQKVWFLSRWNTL